jgi:hypothetical protein
VKVGLIDVDSKIPNLALMKISTWHKSQGDSVEWYGGVFDKPDRVYCSKVFTFTPDHQYPLEGVKVIKGGTGYDISSQLSSEVDSICPDYSLYPDMDYSLGFLTRGCPNKCPWCFVPAKEGNIRPYADIDDFCRHDNVLLMDNNVLACEWGLKQIEKIAEMDIKVDFNQGLDARLIDDSVAKLLSRVKWWKSIRLACDTEGQMKYVQKAVELLRWYNAKPHKGQYSCYVLLKPGELQDCINRVRFLKGIYVDPFVQPYQPPEGRDIPQDERDLARYVDMKAVFKSVWWENYAK